MKINDENIIPPRIKQIIERCDELREYYYAKKLHKPLTNADYYHAGKIHAYEDVLDMFEQLGIIENIEDEEDGQNSID
jgi:hypothetical protein